LKKLEQSFYAKDFRFRNFFSLLLTLSSLNAIINKNTTVIKEKQDENIPF